MPDCGLALAVLLIISAMGTFLSNKCFASVGMASGSVSGGAGIVIIVVGSTVTEDVVIEVSGVESAESTRVQDVNIKAANATTINTSKTSRFIS